MAVSRDLRKHFLTKKGQYFIYPAQVLVESDNPSIQGCYWIYDTMGDWSKHVGYQRNRIDLFFMNSKDNLGGEAYISNKIDNC